MSESTAQQAESATTIVETGSEQDKRPSYYRIRFRKQGREYTAQSRLSDLAPGDSVMIRTEHNPEPAVIVCRAPNATQPGMERGFSYEIIRRATNGRASGESAPARA